MPNEFLLDPRYAPPQQYIMSTQTPRAPPLPIAAGLSPILWRLNSPDRFDMWSAGVVLLQLAFSPLRTDTNIIAFNKYVCALGVDVAPRWVLCEHHPALAVPCTCTFSHSHHPALTLPRTHPQHANPINRRPFACGTSITCFCHMHPAPHSRKLGSEFDYDLRRWRRSLQSAKGSMRKEYAEGFAVLDADGGAGWDLLCSLMQFQPEARLSAAKALQHPWLQRDALTAMGVLRSVAAQVLALGAVVGL